jgi:hypothetical protein
MRTIAIQADGGPDGNDAVMEAALLFIVTHIPVGLKGFKFDGDLHNGTIVNHRHQGEWVVSFRPTGRDAATRRRDPSPHLHQPPRRGAGHHRAPSGARRDRRTAGGHQPPVCEPGTGCVGLTARS